jgi:type VI secretion system protein ImpM
VTAGPPGFFGKVTSHGDFVTRRLPPDMVQAWDDWLQPCIHASKQQLGGEWLRHYLTSPVWRFATSSGVLGQQAWAGVMMPSVDRVGRHFPLMVAAPALPGTPLLDWVRKAAAWYDDLEDLARGSLESDFVLEQFDQQLCASEAAMPAPLPLSNRPAYAAWRLPMQERDQVPQGIAELLLEGHSLWWSDGSPSVEPSMLVCQGMPAPDAFAAMLDGRWQARGWGVARAG